MKYTTFQSSALLALGLSSKLSNALTLDVNSPDSIKSTASVVAYGLMKWYSGNVTNTTDTIAVLPKPYYWWEAGAMWGALIEYYHYTNDSTYNPTVAEALISQVGPSYDYMMPNRKQETGNDDQGFWGFAIMSAAEHGFPDPPAPIPSWLQLTENLWNTQAARWNTESCGGGLKWQVFPANPGYDYKNSVSNGAFFQLSARLARFTGNTTYSDWAAKSWDWSSAIGLIDGGFNIYDGTDDTKNCTEINHIQWSYSVGIYTYGASIMYNITTNSTPDLASAWKDRTIGLISRNVALFFTPYDNATNIMYEQACETIQTCNYDQNSFKAYLARFWWGTTRMAPFTAETIAPLLSTSAVAAANSCSGDGQGVVVGVKNVCGGRWYINGYDNYTGPGQQLAALETITGLLTNSTTPPGQKGQIVKSRAISSSEMEAKVTAVTPSAALPVIAPTGAVFVSSSSTGGAAWPLRTDVVGLASVIVLGTVVAGL